MQRLSILFAGLLAVGLLAASCNKNLLEKPQGGTFTVDTVFHTKLNASGAVAQMYNLCIPAGFPQNTNFDITRFEMVTDELYMVHPAYDWMRNVGNYVTGIETVDATIDREGFGAHYLGIRQANLVLKNIDEVTDADATWKSQVKGQALFCRAMQHFELFRQYGGIPLVADPLDGTQQLNIHRSSVATTVDSIVSWCDQAAALLPATWGTTDYGRATSLAAKALKAR